MLEWHRQLNGLKSEQTPGDSEGQPVSKGLQRVRHDWETEQQLMYYSNKEYNAYI